MVTDARIIKAIELCKGARGGDDLTVSQEAPDLPQLHCKALFRLPSLELAAVVTVPALQFGVVPQQDVLDLLEHFFRLVLEFHQVTDVNHLPVRILFHLASGLRDRELAGAAGRTLRLVGIRL